VSQSSDLLDFTAIEKLDLERDEDLEPTEESD
jgi:hypothetical protein